MVAKVAAKRCGVFNRHPEWRERYGERGVQLGYEDACFHIDFLSAALLAGEASWHNCFLYWASRTSPVGGRVVVAGVQGELHQPTKDRSTT